MLQSPTHLNPSLTLIFPDLCTAQCVDERIDITRKPTYFGNRTIDSPVNLHNIHLPPQQKGNLDTSTYRPTVATPDQVQPCTHWHLNWFCDCPRLKLILSLTTTNWMDMDFLTLTASRWGLPGFLTLIPYSCSESDQEQIRANAMSGALINTEIETDRYSTVIECSKRPNRYFTDLNHLCDPFTFQFAIDDDVHRG